MPHAGDIHHKDVLPKAMKRRAVSWPKVVSSLAVGPEGLVAPMTRDMPSDEE